MSQKVFYMSHFADKTISKVYLSTCDLYILDKCANFAAQIPRKRGSRQGGRRRRSEAVDFRTLRKTGRHAARKVRVSR